MKKILLSSIFLLNFLYANDFNKDAKDLLNNKNAINIKRQYKNIDRNIQKVNKIFSLVFKSQTNLMPKFIKYIYFEPLKDSSEKLLFEQIKSLLIAYNVNLNSKVYIQDIGKETDFILENIKGKIPKSNIFVIKNNKEFIFSKIEEDIIKSTNKTEFDMIEMRVLILSAASNIKENLAYAYTFFNNNLKGVEVENFSYLDISREKLNQITNEEKIKIYESMLKAIK